MGIKTLKKKHQTLALCLHWQAITKIYFLCILSDKTYKWKLIIHHSSIHQVSRPYLGRFCNLEGDWTKFGAVLVLTAWHVAQGTQRVAHSLTRSARYKLPLLGGAWRVAHSPTRSAQPLTGSAPEIGAISLHFASFRLFALSLLLARSLDAKWGYWEGIWLY